MIFKLLDENNNYKEYTIELKFESVDDFLEWHYDDADFEAFMDKMECDHADYAGVHDGTGEDDWFGYSSYEIQNFTLAISMWKDFFESKNLLINGDT